MDRFFIFFLRLLVMAAGFFTACIAAAALLAFLTRLITPEDVRNLTSGETAAGVIVGVLAVASIIGYAAMLPAIFVVFFAEMRRRRGWMFYTVSGGVIAALCLSFVLANPDQDSAPSVEFVAIAVVCGMLGGMVYWIVAGRQAGGWLPRQLKRARRESRDDA